MRRLVCLVLFALLPMSGFAQVVTEGGTVGHWFFALEDGEADGPILIVEKSKFEHEGIAYAEFWYRSQITFVSDEYIQEPEQIESPRLDYWCNLFLGWTDLYDDDEAQGIIYICTVEEMLYVIMLYGTDLGEHLPVLNRATEEMILYDYPETPEGWIDISKDLEERYGT